MGYRVVKYFTDLQDNNYAYHVGDSFPHDGMTVSEERFAELSSDKNKRGTPLIEKIAEEVPEISEETVTSEPEPVVEEEAPKKPAKRSKKVEKENKDAE